MNRREFLAEQREATHQTGIRAYAIVRQPWRIWRNRRLCAEIRDIAARADALYGQQVRPP